MDYTHYTQYNQEVMDGLAEVSDIEILEDGKGIRIDLPKGGVVMAWWKKRKYNVNSKNTHWERFNNDKSAGLQLIDFVKKQPGYRTWVEKAVDNSPQPTIATAEATLIVDGAQLCIDHIARKIEFISKREMNPRRKVAMMVLLQTINEELKQYTLE